MNVLEINEEMLDDRSLLIAEIQAFSNRFIESHEINTLSDFSTYYLRGSIRFVEVTSINKYGLITLTTRILDEIKKACQLIIIKNMDFSLSDDQIELVLDRAWSMNMGNDPTLIFELIDLVDDIVIDTIFGLDNIHSNLNYKDLRNWNVNGEN